MSTPATQPADRPYTPILATLGYVLSPDGRRVLLVHRNRRPDDAHLGKYNGLGGKVEPDEDVVACMRREIREEAGIECDELVLRGTDQLARLRQARRGLVRLRLPHRPLERHAAGREPGGHAGMGRGRSASWSCRCGRGTGTSCRWCSSATGRQFHGVMPYRDGRPVSWSYSLV